MAITRWDPLTDLVRLQNDMTRVFGRAFGSESLDMGARAWTPPLDVFEREDAYVVSLEVPGVEPVDVEVTFEDSTLVVRGERRFYEKVDEEALHRIERRFGRFERSLTMPWQVDADRIQAEYRNGVLTLRLPKAESARPRRIEIRTTG